MKNVSLKAYVIGSLLQIIVLASIWHYAQRKDHLPIQDAQPDARIIGLAYKNPIPNERDVKFTDRHGVMVPSSMFFLRDGKTYCYANHTHGSTPIGYEILKAYVCDGKFFVIHKGGYFAIPKDGMGQKEQYIKLFFDKQ